MSSHAAPPLDVAIIGGGPVGTYLAARLAQEGRRVAVFEARTTRDAHSRAIGVHPPGLAALDALGAAEPLVRRGVTITRGRVYGARGASGPRPLGRLELGAVLPPPHPYVLSVPQSVSEAVLEARLNTLAPRALRRGVRVTSVRQDADGVCVRTEPAAGARPATGGRDTVRARLAVACDGSHGAGAAWLGVPVNGRHYGDTYLMADLPGDAGLGRDAAIFLAPEGVVESFPLPGGRRRWVARTPRLERPADPRTLRDLVRLRTSVALDAEAATGTSAFGAGRRTAARLAVGRIWLCGDAAHVVSPIGGQGMNLGLVGAECAARHLLAALRGARPLAQAADGYDRAQRAAARRAARRAAWNMRLGRPTRLAWAREGVIRLLVRPPLAPWAARVFTMQA